MRFHNDSVSPKDRKSRVMFELGGKCLAYHGPMLYEAKILKIWDHENKKISMLSDGHITAVEDAVIPGENDSSSAVPKELVDNACYFVHYQGWKATWDEWIGLDRIHEYNEENLALKKKLVEEARDAKKLQQEQQRKRKASSNVVGGSGKKSKQELGKHSSLLSRKGAVLNGTSGSQSTFDTTNTDEGGKRSWGQGSSGAALSSPNSQNNIPRIILHIPVRLKSLLVDDWEFVTKDKKICQLPSPTMTVDQIITNYETAMSKELESPASQSQLSEYCAGLRLYFEKSLPILLLYRLERLQFDELLKKEKFSNEPFCKIYGPVHLLRLLSILPELMTTTTMDSQSCQLIVKQTELLLEWLVTNIDELFDTHDKKNYYVNTSSQYEGVALGM